MTGVVDLSEAPQSTDTPTPEEVVALLNQAGMNEQPEPPSELEIACGGQLMLVQCPAIFTIEEEQGQYVEFVVDDIQAWGWTPFGVLGVGHYAKDEEGIDRTVHFQGSKVVNIELQKDLYSNLLEAAGEEAAEDAPDEENSAGDPA